MINGAFEVSLEDGTEFDGPLVDYVAEGIGERAEGGMGRYWGICIQNRGDVVAGIVLHNYVEHSNVVELSAYASGPWLNRRIVHAVFDLIFNRMGVRAVMARHDERNSQARKLWARLGADEHVLPDLCDDGVAECIVVYTKRRWEESNYGW